MSAHPVPVRAPLGPIRHYLALGNRTMMVSGLAMAVAVAAAYPFAHRFGLALQAVAHLSIAVAAGAFKLGYVMRLAAQHELTQAQSTRSPVHTA